MSIVSDPLAVSGVAFAQVQLNFQCNKLGSSKYSFNECCFALSILFSKLHFGLRRIALLFLSLCGLLMNFLLYYVFCIRVLM
jgi:hypothetical protein